MSVWFVRRRNLGRGSVKGMRNSMSVPTTHFKHWTNKTFGSKEEPSLIVRWGCTAAMPFDGVKVLNRVSAINCVNDKRGFRALMRDILPDLIPSSVFTLEEAQDESLYPMVVRRAHHAQGKHLWLVNDYSELQAVVNVLGEGNWYASKYIKKVSEYRVYVVSGKVVTVAEKTPENPDAIAWNVAQGGHFDVVKWDDWPLSACHNACKVLKHTGLDFGGVDVMIDEEGKDYLIEVNSAPSLPYLSDGSTSYRQRMMGRAFEYIYNNGNDWLDINNDYGNWRDVIHPCVWPRESSN